MVWNMWNERNVRQAREQFLVKKFRDSSDFQMSVFFFFCLGLSYWISRDNQYLTETSCILSVDSVTIKAKMFITFGFHVCAKKHSYKSEISNYRAVRLSQYILWFFFWYENCNRLFVKPNYRSISPYKIENSFLPSSKIATKKFELFLDDK